MILISFSLLTFLNSFRLLNRFFHITFCFRKEVDDFIAVSDAGSTKRNALSIFKIARKLLFILSKEDKLVSITILFKI